MKHQLRAWFAAFALVVAGTTANAQVPGDVELKYELRPASSMDSIEVTAPPSTVVGRGGTLTFQSRNVSSGNPPKPVKKPAYVMVFDAGTHHPDHTAFGKHRLDFDALVRDGFTNANHTSHAVTVVFEYHSANGDVIHGWHRGKGDRPFTGPSVVVDGDGGMGVNADTALGDPQPLVNVHYTMKGDVLQLEPLQGNVVGRAGVLVFSCRNEAEMGSGAVKRKPAYVRVFTTTGELDYSFRNSTLPMSPRRNDVVDNCNKGLRHTVTFRYYWANGSEVTVEGGGKGGPSVVVDGDGGVFVPAPNRSRR